ncbi:MAG: hypothetical protein ABI579_03545, partial [Candidatus Sumerlaeota bacterium]
DAPGRCVLHTRPAFAGGGRTKMKFSVKNISLLATLLFATPAVIHAADTAWFIRDGALLRHAVGPDKTTADKIVRSAKAITAFHGTMRDGSPIVSLGNPSIEDGYVVKSGVDIVALNEDGSTRSTLATNALRAYPSPSGDKIAILPVDPIGDVTIWEHDAQRTIPFANRVTLVSWSPDEKNLCVTAYPADWTPYKTNNPENTQDFLRLLNSDLYLIAVATGESRQLTNAPGYDYNGIFSPAGDSIMFISSRGGRGAFYELNLADNAIRQLTNTIPGSYDVPIGRSDTIVWMSSGAILYEAQESHGTSTIREINADGSGAKNLGIGKQPRLIGDHAVFLGEDRSVKEVANK